MQRYTVVLILLAATLIVVLALRWLLNTFVPSDLED